MFTSNVDIAFEVGYQDAQNWHADRSETEPQCPYDSILMRRAWQDGWAKFFIEIQESMAIDDEDDLEEHNSAGDHVADDYANYDDWLLGRH